MSSEPLAFPPANADIVDADLWCRQPTAHDLVEYLPRSWQKYLQQDLEGGDAFGYWLPGSMFPIRGGVSATSGNESIAELERHCEQVGIRSAIVSSGAALSVSALANPTFAAAVARAANDWMLGSQLPVGGRFVTSIVVSGRDPAAAAAEVQRLADERRVVQVQLAFPPGRLGERRFEPLFAAAAAAKLPIQLLADGAYAGANRGVVHTGYPATWSEYSVEMRFGCQPHVMSMIASGVFARHPDLRLVLSGFGVAWLPAFVWAADTGVVGSADRLPSEIIAEHVRLTTARTEQVPQPARLAELLSLVDAGRVLLYASGPDGADDPGDNALLRTLPDASAGAVLAGTARVLYRPPLDSRLSAPLAT